MTGLHGEVIGDVFLAVWAFLRDEHLEGLLGALGKGRVHHGLDDGLLVVEDLPHELLEGADIAREGRQLGNRLPFHVEIANAFPEVSAVVGRPRVGRGAEFPQLLLLQREVPRQYLVWVDVIVVFAECEDLHLSLDDGVEAFSKVIFPEDEVILREDFIIQLLADEVDLFVRYVFVLHQRDLLGEQAHVLNVMDLTLTRRYVFETL